MIHISYESIYVLQSCCAFIIEETKYSWVFDENFYILTDTQEPNTENFVCENKFRHK